jgi:pimeloyl-ACP methyl ester carboxylesterase
MNEPLLLLPGMMCDARVFLPQIVALSRDRAVQVGNVSSGGTVELIAEQVLAAAPARFALAGHGLGGVVAMEVARRAPDRVTRIALLDTNAQSEMPNVAAAREAQIVKARAGRLADAIRDGVKSGDLAPGPRNAGILKLLMDMALEFGPEVYIRQCRVMQRRPDQQKTLRVLRAPALVVCGLFDQITPLRRHEFMATLIPHARLEAVADAGHFPMLEQPDETTRLVRSWLAQPLVLR